MQHIIYYKEKSTQTSHAIQTKSMALYVFSLKQQLISLKVTACITGKIVSKLELDTNNFQPIKFAQRFLDSLFLVRFPSTGQMCLAPSSSSLAPKVSSRSPSLPSSPTLTKWENGSSKTRYVYKCV